MHIGILQFDSVRPELQPVHGDYPLMLQRLLTAIRSDLQFTVYNYPAGETADNPAQCDAWLTTGSQWSVYDPDPWISKAQDFVLALHEGRHPLVAICFGHQLVAQALGGRVDKADAGWGVGAHTATVYQTKPWMQPAVEQFSLLVSHQDQVLEPAPEAEWLAGHDFCPYDLMQIGEHTLTFQGHPEFVPEYSRELLNRRREQLGEALWQAGIDSLQTPINKELSARWILAFMEQARTARNP